MPTASSTARDFFFCFPCMVEGQCRVPLPLPGPYPARSSARQDDAVWCVARFLFVVGAIYVGREVVAALGAEFIV